MNSRRSRGRVIMELEVGMGYNEQREQRKGCNGLMTGMGYNEKEKEQGKGYNGVSGWNGS